MAKFIASMSYELSSDTPADARKLLRAELVGRRWHDNVRDRRLPRQSVWMERTVSDDVYADQVHLMCAEDLKTAAAAVADAGRQIRVLRAFIQVTGGGSYGLAPEGFFDQDNT